MYKLPEPTVDTPATAAAPVPSNMALPIAAAPVPSNMSCDLVKGFKEKVLMVMVCLYSRFMFVKALNGESSNVVAKEIGVIFSQEGLV